MPFTTKGKNKLLDESWTKPNKCSLHSAEPNAEGSNEISGGSYARKEITWNAVSGGSLDNNANPVFDVPAGKTITYVGYWDAAGDLVAFDDITSETFGSAGTYTLTDADLTLT